MYAAAVLAAGPGSAALAAAGRGLVCGGWTRTSLYANPRNIQLGRGRAGRWVTAPPLTATLTSLATLTRESSNSNEQKTETIYIYQK